MKIQLNFPLIENGDLQNLLGQNRPNIEVFSEGGGGIRPYRSRSTKVSKVGPSL